MRYITAVSQSSYPAWTLKCPLLQLPDMTIQQQLLRRGGSGSTVGGGIRRRETERLFNTAASRLSEWRQDVLACDKACHIPPPPTSMCMAPALRQSTVCHADTMLLQDIWDVPWSLPEGGRGYGNAGPCVHDMVEMSMT